jgi:hypothetical protein
MDFNKKYRDAGTSLPVSRHSGATRIGLATKKFGPVSLFFQEKERTTGHGFVWIARITYFNSPGSSVLKQNQNDYLHELSPLLSRAVRRVAGS